MILILNSDFILTLVLCKVCNVQNGKEAIPNYRSCHYARPSHGPQKNQ